MATSYRLLPPRLVGLLVVAMIALRVLAPGPTLVDLPFALVGLVPLAVGITLNVTSALRFTRIGTNIVTFDDPGTLVADGWFTRTRNPMYLGFTLVLVGLALLLGTATVWVGPVAFVAVANWWYIPFEERRMRARFGDDYVAYAKRVRRWL